MVAPDGSERDVAVEAHPDATIQELVAAFAPSRARDSSQLYLLRTGAWLEPTTNLETAGLLHGDRVFIGEPNELPPRISSLGADEERSLALVVVGGTNIGLRAELRPGTVRVGRGRECEVQIDDPALSRTHLVLEVSGRTVSVRDAGSTNGTFLDGVRLEDGHRWAPGEVIEAGGSLLALASEMNGRPATVQASSAGRLLFNRPPRVAEPEPRLAFDVPAAPDTGGRPRLPLASAAVPLLIALVLWRMFPDNPSLLVIMALSPVMVVISYLEERRRGGRAGRKGEEAWRTQVASLIEEVTAARESYAQRLRAETPDSAELLRRARTRSAELWERRARDQEFLTIRCGWGDRPWPLELRRSGESASALHREVDDLLGPLEVLPSVPLTVDARSAGVMGLAGDLPSVEAMARWMLLQLVTLHSPEEVSVIAVVHADSADAWQWMSWVPHADRTTVTAGVSVIEELVSLIERRRAAKSPASMTDPDIGPVIVVLIDHRTRPPRAQTTRLLREGPAVGVHAIWMGTMREDLPGETGAIVELTGTDDVVITIAESGDQLRGAREGVSVEACREAALALAPLVDAAPRERSKELPRRVSLFTLLGLEEADPSTVARLWDRETAGLSIPIGVGSDGPVSLDLDRDGPHALVAGTTGSGKSELLQTLVASLTWHLSPERVNLLLIDYKGGAAFKDCAELPHAVGLVTDLDAQLSHRALVSLDAELKRRERVLRDAGARDVTEIEQRGGERIPRLILIIDEFAALVKELPAFVDGMIDLAQRGRSLGIHLVLATQRPAGVINDAIRANTNLRIALRVADEPDSSDVVGTTEAAHIPRTIPGRALLRRGHGEVEHLQSAFSGAPIGGGGRVVVRDLAFDAALDARQQATMDTQLQAVVAAIRATASERGIPQARSPWLPPLPALLHLEDVSSRGNAGGAAFGLVDRPQHQQQEVARFDPSDAGGLLVYGAAGAGKTTLLRTVAGSLGRTSSPAELHMYGLDFGDGGLRPLRALPHCGDVVPGEEHDRVERFMAMLRDEIDRRKRSGSQATSAMWLVMLDGYEGFSAAFERVNMGELVDVLPRLVADGRGVGVHFAVTAERRPAIPSALAAMFATRVVLRMADEDEFLALGLDRRAVMGIALPPGRGFLGGHPLQVATLGPEGTRDAQAAALEQIASVTGPVSAERGPRPVGLLPTDVDLDSLRAAENPLTGAFGVTETDLSEVTVDVTSGHFLIAGPYRSGRSTALLTLARSLRASPADGEFWFLAPPASAIATDAVWDRTALGTSECEEALASLAGRTSRRPALLFVDDADEFTEGPCSYALEPVVKQRDGNTRVIAAAESLALHRSFGGWLSEIRKHKRGLLLDPDLDLDGDLLGTKLPRRQKRAFPPGRGYLVDRGRLELVQTAR